MNYFFFRSLPVLKDPRPRYPQAGSEMERRRPSLAQAFRRPLGGGPHPVQGPPGKDTSSTGTRSCPALLLPARSTDSDVMPV